MAKRKRKMTAAQKAAAVERLAKAREKRQPKYSQYHPDVVALPDDDTLSMKNVRTWIKYNREKASALQKAARSGNKEAIPQVEALTGYIHAMDRYLKTSVWTDMFYGAERNMKMGHRCIAMAYYPDGKPKRQVGTWYPDVRTVWTQEMENDELVSYGREPQDTTAPDVSDTAPKVSTEKKKNRKKRELTEEQKKALRQRLAKARAAKAAKQAK